MNDIVERLTILSQFLADINRPASETALDAAALIQSLYTKIARKNAVLGEVQDWIRLDLEAGTPKASAALRMVAEALAEDGGEA